MQAVYGECVCMLCAHVHTLKSYQAGDGQCSASLSSHQGFPGLLAWPFRQNSPESGPLLKSDAAAAAAKLLQSCLTLCNPIDGIPRSSSIPGILQARTLVTDG